MKRDEEQKNGGVSPLGAAAAGAAAGMAAVLLSNKKNREAIATQVKKAKKIGEEKLGEARETLRPILESGEEKNDNGNK